MYKVAQTALALLALFFAMRAEAQPSSKPPVVGKKGRDQVRPDAHTDVDAKPGNTDTSTSYANALRIARMLNDDRVVAKLLARHGLTKGATDADLVAVVKAYETAGEPETAAKFLMERAKLYPTEKRVRPILAALLSRSGESARAVTVWKEQMAVFGKDVLTLDHEHAYARDLSRAGDVDAAYAVLVGLSAKAPPDAKELWLDVATLAWDRDDDALALSAYEKVYKADPKTPYAGARYLALLTDAGRIEDATQIALAEHKRTGDPTSVIFIGHIRAAKNEWPKLNELLDAALAQSPKDSTALVQNADFLTLRGDSRRHAGDLRGAAEMYDRALAVAPDSPTVRANVLWTQLELGNVKQARAYATQWNDFGLKEELLWAPMAVAFARGGMYNESLPFFERQLKANPHDGRALLELADVLFKIERHSLAANLRRRAAVQLRAEALKALRAPKPTADDLHVIESTAIVVRERSGIPQGEKWLRAMSAANPTFRGQEETAVDWYIATDRAGYAQRLLHRNARPAHDLYKYRLALAMHDEDRASTALLVESAHDLSPGERMHAATLLGNDREAAAAIGEGLASERAQPDEAEMRSELARIHWLHRPNVRLATLYSHVTGLDVFGAQAAAAHDAFGGRIVYTATGSHLTDRSDTLNLSGAVYEGDVGALFRNMTPRGVTEAGASFNYQKGTPLGRAAFFDQRLLTSKLGITTDLRLAQRIDDTGFLRLAAARNIAGVGLRYDEHRWYVSAEIEGREDQTRRYQHLAWDVVESAEAGVKILTREPHLSLGVQAQASQRDTRTVLPASAAAFLPEGVARERALPPSFQLVGGVIHFSRGDFLERYRPDRAPFPRYDCEAAFGVMSGPDTALHLLCGVSVRAPGGYASLIAFYNRGIAGVRNNENAEAALSWTIPLH